MSAPVEAFPPILLHGIKYLKYLGSIGCPNYGLVPIVIIEGKKKPMVKIREHLHNIHRVDDDSFIVQWKTAQYYGVVLNPRYNPGIIKQVFVVDVDVPTDGGHRKDGRIHIDKLDITNTFTVQTASGGIHHIYTMPLGTKLSPCPYDGIDIVYNSPFYHIGVGSPGYKLINKTDIAEASEELLKQLKTSRKMNLKEDITHGNSLLAHVRRNGVDSGKRHNTMVDITWSLSCQRIPKDVAMAVMELMVSKCDKSPGAPTMDEVEAMFDDAVSKSDSEGITLEALLDSKVFVDSANMVFDIKNIQSLGVPLVAFRVAYSSLIPNINKPLNAQGNYPLNSIGSVWADSSDKHVVNSISYQPGGPRLLETEHNKFLNKYHAPIFDMEVTTDELLLKRFKSVFKRTFGPIYMDWLKVIKFKYVHPEVKFSWCIYLTSVQEGTGKGLSWKFTEKVFGAQNCLSVNPNDIAQQFNASLSECTFALIDEAQGAKTRVTRNAQMNDIKRIITENTMTIESKGKEKVLGTSSYFFMYIFSNDESSIDVNANSRRFLVYHDKSLKTKEEIKLMSTMSAYMDDPNNIAIIMRWIMETVDITESEEFTPKGEARKTEDLLHVNELRGLTKEEIEVREDILNKVGIFESDIVLSHQLRYYCIEKYNNNYHINGMQVYGTITSQFNLHALVKRRTQGSNYCRTVCQELNTSLAEQGVSVRDAYVPRLNGEYLKQKTVFIVRDTERYNEMNSATFRQEIKRAFKINGPRELPLKSV